METTSFKILSLRLLQGNQQGNIKETSGFHRETFKETATGNGGTKALLIPIADWQPEPVAWLTPEGELKTTGVFDDLAGEIVRLTADNLPLQAKLLRECAGAYSGPQWIHTIRRWRERARHLFEVEGIGLNEANYQAAKEMHLLAFCDELMFCAMTPYRPVEA
jgi:hypothetical protein